MSNVFKKAANLPIVISFTHSISKARDYYGCPRVVAECVELGFKAVTVGYGYDMIGALMSNFINSNCTQYVIEAAYAFNELRGDSYNPVRYNKKTDEFRVNLCIPDCVQFFDDIGLVCKLVSKKNGQIVTCVISSK